MYEIKKNNPFPKDREWGYIKKLYIDMVDGDSITVENERSLSICNNMRKLVKDFKEDYKIVSKKENGKTTIWKIKRM